MAGLGLGSSACRWRFGGWFGPPLGGRFGGWFGPQALTWLGGWANALTRLEGRGPCTHQTGGPGFGPSVRLVSGSEPYSSGSDPWTPNLSGSRLRTVHYRHPADNPPHLICRSAALPHLGSEYGAVSLKGARAHRAGRANRVRPPYQSSSWGTNRLPTHRARRVHGPISPDAPCRVESRLPMTMLARQGW